MTIQEYLEALLSNLNLADVGPAIDSVASELRDVALSNHAIADAIDRLAVAVESRPEGER